MLRIDWTSVAAELCIDYRCERNARRMQTHLIIVAHAQCSERRSQCFGYTIPEGVEASMEGSELFARPQVAVPKDAILLTLSLRLALLI